MSHPELTPEQFGAAFKAFMEAVASNASVPGPQLSHRIREHLGQDPTRLPVLTEEFDPHEQPNLQAAMDEYSASNDRKVEIAGLASQHRHYFGFGLAILASQDGTSGFPPFIEGPVDYVNIRLAEDRVLPCVQFGVYFVIEGSHRLVIAITGPSEQHGPRQVLRVEVMSAEPDSGAAFLESLRERMLRLNVYRGQVISLTPGQLGMGPQALISFHSLPRVERTDVILPESLLARIERHTITFARHTQDLLAAGRSLKRGMLLYGVPGTGKTLTLMYLISQLPGRTVLLTSGLGLGLLQPVMQIARTLAPSMVVLEDVDLIAEERGHPAHQSRAMLFQLLNEMDGLRDDIDVMFVLTTNRPDVLEPALAARPGRVDLAVELPLPDAPARHKLFDLYAHGISLHDVDPVSIVARTEGASPAFIKELLRRAAVIAASVGSGATVTGNHMEAALEELSDSRLSRQILGHQQDDPQLYPGFPPR